MNEVEKMYRNSGVEKHKKAMLDIETGKDVLTLDSFYPEFTAEKQLELIKWLSINYLIESKKIDSTQEYYIGVETDNKKNEWWASVNFENALAAIINNLWQDLTEEERKQIKEILE